jgi:hypothetical protein
VGESVHANAATAIAPAAIHDKPARKLIFDLGFLGLAGPE